MGALLFHTGTLCLFYFYFSTAISPEQRNQDSRPVEAEGITESNRCDDDSSYSRPNIMFILLDSLGWGDLSTPHLESQTPGKFPTPNLDGLFSNSVLLNRHYVHLSGSPSRSQFMTGRYAMNLGFGHFHSWTDSTISGIPIGQPTIANWLSEFGDYTTYGVGKWNLGYANRMLTPLHKGFDHFYGFYQDAIDYERKTYDYHGVGMTDFWEDSEPILCGNIGVMEHEMKTLDLYSAKIMEYLDNEADKAMMTNDTTPFYMYIGLQSMHTSADFPELEEYEDDCLELVASDTGSDFYKFERQKYCALLRWTDRVVGEIIDSLIVNDLYEDTLIVFSAVNGGATDHGANNYPLRGTMGELHDGNIRTLTAISGGVIQRENVVGHIRDDMMSSLDWTPTLLDFAGYLDCINPADYTWDGESQRSMILNLKHSKRDSIILNIEDEDLHSASILVEYDRKIYKFVQLDRQSPSVRSISSKLLQFYADHPSDTWSAKEGVSVLAFDPNDEQMKYSQPVNGQSLFELSTDPSEFNNLLDTRFPPISDTELNAEIISKCKRILRKYIKDNPLFSQSLEFLDQPLEEGIPTKSTDLIMRPFLDDDQYVHFVEEMFEKETHRHSEEQKDLYLHQWSAPERVGVGGLVSMTEESEEGSKSSTSNHPWWERILGIVSVFAGTCTVVYLFWKCYQHGRSKINERRYENKEDDERMESNEFNEGDALLNAERDETRTTRRVTL